MEQKKWANKSISGGKLIKSRPLMMCCEKCDYIANHFLCATW